MGFSAQAALHHPIRHQSMLLSFFCCVAGWYVKIMDQLPTTHADQRHRGKRRVESLESLYIFSWKLTEVLQKLCLLWHLGEECFRHLFFEILNCFACEKVFVIVLLRFKHLPWAPIISQKDSNRHGWLDGHLLGWRFFSGHAFVWLFPYVIKTYSLQHTQLWVGNPLHWISTCWAPSSAASSLALQTQRLQFDPEESGMPLDLVRGFPLKCAATATAGAPELPQFVTRQPQKKYSRSFARTNPVICAPLGEAGSAFANWPWCLKFGFDEITIPEVKHYCASVEATDLQALCNHICLCRCCLEIIFSLVWMCVAGAEDIGSITMGSSGCWHRGSQFFPESAPFPDARAQGLFYPVVSVYYTFIFCFGIVSCFLWCPVSQKRPPVRLSWWSFDGVPGRKLMNKMEYDKYLFVNFSHSKHGLIMTPAVPICFRSQGCPTSCGSKLLHFGSPIVTWRTPLRILRRLQAAFLLDTESYTWVQNNCWSHHYSLLNLLFTGTKLWITDWERLLKHHEHCRGSQVMWFWHERKTRACVTEAHGSIFFPQNGVVSQSEEPIIGILLYWSLKTNCQKRPIITRNTHRNIVTHSYHTDPMRIFVAISHVWTISQISQNQM